MEYRRSHRGDVKTSNPFLTHSRSKRKGLLLLLPIFFFVLVGRCHKKRPTTTAFPPSLPPSFPNQPYSEKPKAAAAAIPFLPLSPLLPTYVREDDRTSTGDTGRRPRVRLRLRLRLRLRPRGVAVAAWDYSFSFRTT